MMPSDSPPRSRLRRCADWLALAAGVALLLVGADRAASEAYDRALRVTRWWRQ